MVSVLFICLFQAIVIYYYRFEFKVNRRYLRVDDCNQIKKTDREAEKDEIFLYTGSGIPKNIDAETILWKCSVYDFEHRQSSYLFSPRSLRFLVLIKRFTFQFRPLVRPRIKKRPKRSNSELIFFCRAFFDAKGNPYKFYYIELKWLFRVC